MSTYEQTAEEVSESLTGFDEIAVAQQFGQTIAELATKDPSMFLRALVFVTKRREGATDSEAHTAALELTMKGCAGYFAETSDEEAGKDEAPEPLPGNSLSSVS